MTTLSDFLRDNYGNILRIYPSTDGELNITTLGWDHADGEWSGPSYTIPTEGYEYRTLADSGGTVWYAYLVRLETGDEAEPYHWELRLSTVAPTAQPAGIWRDPKYGGLSETEAATGSEVYLAFGDINGTDWYVYPTTEGEFRITTIQPS